MFASFVRRLALVTALAIPLGACDLADAIEDRLDGPEPTAADPGTTDIGGGPDVSNPSPSTPTPTAPTTPIDVTLDVRLRIVVVNGQMVIEADCDWTATGAANLVVDVQMKSDLQPIWTDMLTDQPAVDVGSFIVYGGRQDYHFRATAQDLDHPERVGTSTIVSIRQ